MTKRILLADDSLTIQKVVELTFMGGDYEVSTFGNGDEAAEQMEVVQPDIVIADVHMPGIDGYGLCAAVKGLDAGIPVVLLVGTFEPFDESEAERVGADAHLKKPFDSQELLKLVEDLSSGLAGEVSVAGESDFEVTSDEDFEPQAATEDSAPADISDAESSLPIETHAGESVSSSLSDDDIERVARRVVELLGKDLVREVAWEVIPDLAEIVIKDRIRELESAIE